MSLLKMGVVVVLTAAMVCLLIYLTPLKNINLVQPVTKDINPQDFWKEYQAHPDKYVFIDVRQSDAYKKSHAKGSINKPIQTLFEGYKDLPKSGKTIVLICTGGAESGVAYGYLEHQGFLNLLRIHGGLINWVGEALPTESVTVERND